MCCDAWFEPRCERSHASSLGIGATREVVAHETLGGFSRWFDIGYAITQQLIELVNQSDLLEDASFRGSTRLDTRTGLEIFEVNAGLVGAKSE